MPVCNYFGIILLDDFTKNLFADAFTDKGKKELQLAIISQ